MGKARGLRAAAITAGGIVGGAAAALALGAALWDRASTKAVRRLHLGSDTPAPALFSPAELAGLPDPVARYLTFALTPGQPFFHRAPARGGRGKSVENQRLCDTRRWKPGSVRIGSNVGSTRSHPEDK
jgi:hypothetical protein